VGLSRAERDACGCRCRRVQLESPDEVKTVLREVVSSISQQEMDDIAAAITKPIGIKRLLMVVENARQGDTAISPDRFRESLHIFGY
jgi:predicted RND superfamily exporter protein